jgi:hypothetical protein
VLHYIEENGFGQMHQFDESINHISADAITATNATAAMA